MNKNALLSITKLAYLFFVLVIKATEKKLLNKSQKSIKFSKEVYF